MKGQNGQLFASTMAEPGAGDKKIMVTELILTKLSKPPNQMTINSLREITAIRHHNKN